jgi:hypothetical protein
MPFPTLTINAVYADEAMAYLMIDLVIEGRRNKFMWKQNISTQSL